MNRSEAMQISKVPNHTDLVSSEIAVAGIDKHDRLNGGRSALKFSRSLCVTEMSRHHNLCVAHCAQAFPMKPFARISIARMCLSVQIASSRGCAGRAHLFAGKLQPDWTLVQVWIGFNISISV